MRSDYLKMTHLKHCVHPSHPWNMQKKMDALQDRSQLSSQDFRKSLVVVSLG